MSNKQVGDRVSRYVLPEDRETLPMFINALPGKHYVFETLQSGNETEDGRIIPKDQLLGIIQGTKIPYDSIRISEIRLEY